MYIVLKNFTDLEDGGHKYRMGEEYPRQGYTPSEERVKALLSGDNKACLKLIQEVKAPKSEEKAEPKAEPAEEPKKPVKKKASKKKSGGKKASK